MFTKNQSGLAVVGRFSFIHEADLAKALLESEGIDSWLLDEHQIRHRWHLGAALGGVKLAVAPEDGPRAVELLAEDRSASLADIEEQALPMHPTEACPRCGGVPNDEVTTQKLPGPIQWAVSLVFLVFGALVPRRRFTTTRHCGECGLDWSEQQTR